MRRPLLLIVLFVCWGSGASGVRAVDVSKPLTLEQVWSLDSTYTDQQHGTTFRYPSVWKPAMQFGYVPPALMKLADPYENQVPQKLIGFAYMEGGFPRDRVVGPYAATNLEGFGIVYSSLPLASAAECEKKAALLASNSRIDNPGHSSVKIAGRTFSVYQTGGEAMNQTYTGKLYATYDAGTCYFVEAGIAAALPGVLDHIHALTPAQVQDINVHLWHIMETVRIARKG